MEDGKRVPLSTRVSEARARALDDARGDMSVSQALDVALGYWLAARTGVPERKGRIRLPRAAHERAPRQREKAAAPVPDIPFSAAPDPCPHPKSRVHKGLCGGCGTYVG